MNKKTKLPLYLTKGKSRFKRTPYNSYIDIHITDGIVQQHNAMSFNELKKLGYK